MEIEHSIGDGSRYLNRSELATLGSIVALAESPRVSDKYSFFSTMNLIDTLETANWHPVIAQQQRVRALSRAGFQRHMIRFRNPEVGIEHGLDPELVLLNSHDGLSTYQFFAGIFRGICLNGMIISEAMFNAIRLRHIGIDEKDVIDASYKVIEEVPRLSHKISDYRNIELTTDERGALAESALLLRFSNGEEFSTDKDAQVITIGNRTFSTADLLRPIRGEDTEKSLWNTFNLIQEKITKGGRFERTDRTMENGRLRRTRQARGINGIVEDVGFNRALWHLMDELAKQKARPKGEGDRPLGEGNSPIIIAEGL